MYKNPVLTGCYPDPSVCRVNDKFYLVNSSFEYFPSIPIFESENLVEWQPLGYCVTSENAVNLITDHPNATGMYAPTIRYNKGIFYVICTNVAYKKEDDGNFIVTATDPKGPWSQPMFLDLPGIDPSLFFDDDGQVYYTGTHGNIYVCKIDPDTGKALEDRVEIWGGTGGCAPEGPHLYKKEGWYYLVISEGGTEHGHMLTIARSKSPYGPFESYDKNPILTNRSKDLPLKAIGHADFVQDQYGDWWSVCLGIRSISYPHRHNLGRETMLIPMDWSEDWPVMGENGIAHEFIEVNRPLLKDYRHKEDKMNLKFDFKSDYDDVLFNTLFKSMDKHIKKSSEGLMMSGVSEDLTSKGHVTFYGLRQMHHEFKLETKLTVTKGRGGIAVYMNNKHYYGVDFDGQKITFKRQVGTMVSEESFEIEKSDSITLILEGDKEWYQFAYLKNQEHHKIGKGETRFLTTEVGGVFTGNYIGMYALSEKNQSNVMFENLNYVEK